MKGLRKIKAEFWLPLLLGLLLWLGFSLKSGENKIKPSASEYGFPAFNEIELFIGKAGLFKLRNKRDQALKTGILETSEFDWVSGKLMEGPIYRRIKLRLKGDWTDHLKGGKWSFRIKVKGDLAYRGMKVFSVQNPRTRNFIKGWYIHQVMSDEDILTTRYDFIRLKVNGNKLGIFAIEEHFSKQMIEAAGYREGLLLKINEDGMWEARVAALQNEDFPFMGLPLYEAAQPEAFQYRRILLDSVLNPQHKMALQLMQAYKFNTKPASEIFDLKNTARYYALIDLFHGHHTLIWHNRRFYFNPLTCKLMPVVFDASTDGEGDLYINGPFSGYSTNGRTFYRGIQDKLGTTFFAEDEFARDYYKYLHEFSSLEFLSQIENKYGEALRKREQFLQEEFLFYSYPTELVPSYAANIRKHLVASPDLIKIESGQGICVQNYNPVAVQLLSYKLRNGSKIELSELRILDAFDGRDYADFEEISNPGVVSLVFVVPGGPPFEVKVN